MSEDEGHFRLLTQSDFDGLVCAALLRNLGLLDAVKFVHPREMEEGLIPVTQRDIVADLPYVEGVHLVVNHDYGEQLRVGEKPNHIVEPGSRSAARVLYSYYGGPATFPDISEEMLLAVDKGDTGDFSRGEVLHPEGWVLLNFILDIRTGLGRFKNFRISNHELMLSLIDEINRLSIDEILRISDVAERVELYFAHQEPFKRQVAESSVLRHNALLLDLRPLETIYAGNRFVKYALFPRANISIRVMWGFERRNTVINVGKSIFNRTSRVNVGSLMRRYGGGGHEAAGTCQVDNDEADRVTEELLKEVREA
ncbi:MAG: exopolyphosphatase [Spirochaetaceae bacterium]